MEGIVGIIAVVALILWGRLFYPYGPYQENVRIALVFWAFVTGAVEIVAGIRLREAIADALLPISMGVIYLLFGIFAIRDFDNTVQSVHSTGIYSLIFGIILIALAFRLRSFRQLES